jgi:hypothetical protein
MESMNREELEHLRRLGEAYMCLFYAELLTLFESFYGDMKLFFKERVLPYSDERLTANEGVQTSLTLEFITDPISLSTSYEDIKRLFQKDVSEKARRLMYFFTKFYRSAHFQFLVPPRDVPFTTVYCTQYEWGHPTIIDSIIPFRVYSGPIYGYHQPKFVITFIARVLPSEPLLDFDEWLSSPDSRELSEIRDSLWQL